jgi:hypothetical protein
MPGVDVNDPRAGAGVYARVQQMLGRMEPNLQEMERIQQNSASGLPQESFAPQIVHGYGGDYAISRDPNAPGGETSTYIGGGKGTWGGDTDEQGYAIGYDERGRFGRLTDKDGKPIKVGNVNTRHPRGGTGSGATAFQKNAQFIAETLGISERDAISYLNNSFRDPAKIDALKERIRSDIATNNPGLSPEEQDAIAQRRIDDLRSSIPAGAPGARQQQQSPPPLRGAQPPAAGGTYGQALPQNLRGNPNIRVSPTTGQFKDTKTGEVFDAQGRLLGRQP